MLFADIHGHHERPDHDVTFVVEVAVDGMALAHGQTRAKKKAEQEAAYEAIKRMDGATPRVTIYMGSMETGSAERMSA